MYVLLRLENLSGIHGVRYVEELDRQRESEI